MILSIFRNSFEILAGTALLFMLFHITQQFPPTTWTSQDTICPTPKNNNETDFYVCSGHNFRIDALVVYLCIGFLILFILVCFGALIWVLVGLSNLSKMMKKGKINFDRVQHEPLDEHEITTDIEDLYYQNR